MGGDRDGGLQQRHGDAPEGAGAVEPVNAGDGLAIAAVANAVNAGLPQVAAVVRQFPAQQRAMIRWLHERCGNAYVQRVLAQGARDGTAAWTVVANPQRVQFPATEVGAVSAPRTITLTNHGSAPVDIASLELVLYGGLGAAAYPGEFELLQNRGRSLRPFETLAVDIVFRPTRVVPHIGARLRAKGAGDHEQVDVTLQAVPAAPQANHADQRELSVAEHDARRLEVTTTPSVLHYGDMLAAVLAARTLTDRSKPDDAEAHTHVKRLLEPVASRLDQLNDHQGRLARFGAGNLAGQVALDISQTAIQSWLRRLALGARINSEEFVTKFRAGAEPIRVLTGEHADAPTLSAFDHVSTMVAIGASVPVLLPALVALAAEEATLLVILGQLAARRVVLWALMHPAAALAAAEALLSFGLQIGEDGWERFWDQLRDPQGRWFIIAQVLMDYVHVKSNMPGSGGSKDRSSSPRPRGASVEPAPEAGAIDVESARRHAARMRAVLQQVHDQASTTSETSAKPTGGTSARTGEPTDGEQSHRAPRTTDHKPDDPSRTRGPSVDGGKPWHTDAKPGLSASEVTIRAETVEMELHPQYQARLDKARAKGFDVVMTTGDPYVEVLEIVDIRGNRLEIHRTLNIRPKMRFLDLEHEMGHIDQLDRFAEPPPTRRMVRTPRGEVKATGNQAQGILTEKQNAVTEYHNRLAEFARLRHGTTPGVLATEFKGIEDWRITAENTYGFGRGDNTITRWAQQHFPEIPDLEAQVRAAGFDLRPRTSRW
jgi:hypothetical protein